MPFSIQRTAALLLTIAVGTAGGLWTLRDREDDDHPARPSEVGISEATFSLAQADMRLRVTLNGKRGYVDGNGKTVIEPAFAMAMPFSEGLAAVANRNPLDGKTNWQFVDATGKVVIAKVFVGGQIGSFHEGLAPIQTKESKWGYINLHGEFAIAPMFDRANDFSQGLAIVRVGRLSGIIGTNGQFVLEPKYDMIGDFSNNFAVFAQNNRYGYLDRQGHIMIEPTFVTASDFSEGFAFVETRTGAHSLGTYVDVTGHPSFDPQPISGGPFRHGLAAIRTRNSAYFIDPTGKVSIQCPGVEKFGNFSEGLAAAQVNGLNGFIDPAGRFVISPQWVLVDDFSQGICRVNSNTVRGYINKAGQYIWKLKL